MKYIVEIKYEIEFDGEDWELGEKIDDGEIELDDYLVTTFIIKDKGVN